MNKRTKKIACCLAAVTSFSGIISTATAGTCSVDFNNKKQTVRGYGACLLGWQGTLSSSDYDIGFGTSGAIGLTIGRIELKSTTNQSGWADEVNRGKASKDRGAIVIASPWSPPAEFKSNGSEVNGYLQSWKYDDYANHMVNFVNYARNNGCTLYGVTCQNEPDYAPDYISCEWTADQLKTFYRNEMGVFGSTKVLTGECFNFKKSYTDTAMADSTARANVDIVAGHIYGSGIAKQNSYGKEVWMTEHLINDQSTTGWNQTMKEINDCMSVAEFNSYIWWYLKRSYGPIDENGNRSKRGCILAQYARWVRPGYSRVACTYNPSSNVYVTAYSGSKKVIVAINTGSSSVYQPFSMSHSIGTFNRYRTNNGGENLSTLSSFSPGSSFGVMLPANSITTYVER